MKASNQQAELREHLLSMDHQVDNQHDCLQQKFKTYSLLIGLCCGVFVQLATLGANFLLGALYGDAIANQSDVHAILFSLLWSFFTSILAFIILAFLRALVNSVLDANTPEDEYQDEEKRFERVTFMMAIEVRYVVGALTGVCFAWTCIDLFFGMQSLAFYSICTLIVAMAWSKTMIWCFTSPAKTSDGAPEKVAYIV